MSNRTVYTVQVYTTIIARSTSVHSFGFRKLPPYRSEADKLCRNATARKLREMRRDIGLTRKRVKREAEERMASISGYATRVDMSAETTKFFNDRHDARVAAGNQSLFTN